MQEKVVRDLELARYGYDIIPKDPAFFSPFPDGRHLFIQMEFCAHSLRTVLDAKRQVFGRQSDDEAMG